MERLHMVKKSRHSINNIKIKYKLALVYLLTGIIPFLVLFFYSYAQMKHILIERDTKTVQNFVNQAGAGIDNQIEIYNNLSNYIAFNETISRIVSYDYKSDYDRYNQFVTILDPMLSSLKYFHNDVKRVTIYTDTDIKHDTTLAPVSEIKDASWYEQASSNSRIQWFADGENHTLISARKMSMLERHQILGILYVDVAYDQVFQTLEANMDDNYGIFIVDQDQNPVYSYARFGTEYADKQLEYSDFKEMCVEENLDQDATYTVISQRLDTTGWTIYMYEPKSLVLRSAKPMVLMIFVAAGVSLCGAVIAILFSSHFITSRIEKLQDNMREVENGNLKVHVRSTDQDEIGSLINGFDQMIDQINTLITEVYQGKISQKEYEMRALRAQINPHFLYNSLSLINWKALGSGQDDISKITLALSNYYRTSLNKGRNTLSLEMELMNMKSYLEIQQIMHDNDFDVEISVDQELMQYEMLNLILQPLVENAIDHGIDLKTEGKGLIRVTGYLTTMPPEGVRPTENSVLPSSPEDTLKNPSENTSDVTTLLGESVVCLTVEDNGVGMDDDTIRSFLTAKSHGYGTRNVNERIMLYYGEQYHLRVSSTLGEGTRITILIPARIYQPPTEK